METPGPYLIPSRLAKRAHYDGPTIFQILDEALFFTISNAVDGKPASIPTSFVRIENKVYIHGSLLSHFIRQLEKGLLVISFMVVESLMAVTDGCQ